MLAERAEFAVTVNTVLGAEVRNPQDAGIIARRTRELGFHSTVGILHDGAGQTRPSPPTQMKIYEDIRKLEASIFRSRTSIIFRPILSARL
jgi:hypothetical protein